jgi:hypothetical protein
MRNRAIPKLPLGSGSLAESAGGWLPIEVRWNSFADAPVPRRHRYDVAQGFQPQQVQVAGRSADEVIGRASLTFGGLGPLRRW